MTRRLVKSGWGPSLASSSASSSCSVNVREKRHTPSPPSVSALASMSRARYAADRARPRATTKPLVRNRFHPEILKAMYAMHVRKSTMFANSAMPATCVVQKLPQCRLRVTCRWSQHLKTRSPARLPLSADTFTVASTEPLRV